MIGVFFVVVYVLAALAVLVALAGLLALLALLPGLALTPVAALAQWVAGKTGRGDDWAVEVVVWGGVLGFVGYALAAVWGWV
jgi:hypothetical protein